MRISCGQLWQVLQRDANPVNGFTLIELLTVSAVLGILAALLLPALAGKQERVRRLSCANTQRQWVVALHLYADENQQRLMPGSGYLPVITSTTSNALLLLLRNPKLLHCPNLADSFKPNTDFQRESAAHGLVIGFNYHGAHSGSPGKPPDYEPWTSPKRTTDGGNLVVLSDMNSWGDGFCFAPHGRDGAVRASGDVSNHRRLPISGWSLRASELLGGLGGNAARLDGSVSWRKISLMKTYLGGCEAMW